MFVTRKTHDAEIKRLEKEVERLSEKTWEMWRAHDRLMRHLGLEEKIPPAVPVIVCSRHEDKGL